MDFLSRLIDEPKSGIFSFLEKNEISLREGLILNRVEFNRYLQNNKISGIDQIYSSIIPYLIRSHNIISYKDTISSIGQERTVISFYEKISSRKMNILFENDHLELILKTPREEIILDDFILIAPYVRPNQIKSNIKAFHHFFNNHDCTIFLRLKRNGENRGEFKEFLSGDSFLESIEEAKDGSLRALQSSLRVHSSWISLRDRIGIFYPGRDLSKSSEDELRNLLVNPPTTMFRFENLETYYILFKKELSRFKRSNKLILKEMTQFDQKLSKISN